MVSSLNWVLGLLSITLLESPRNIFVLVSVLLVAIIILELMTFRHELQLIMYKAYSYL